MDKHKRKAIAALKDLIKTIEKDKTVVGSMALDYETTVYGVTPDVRGLCLPEFQEIAFTIRYTVPIKVKELKAKK